ADRKGGAGRDEQSQHSHGHRDQQRIPQLQPEVTQIVVLLPKHDFEVMQGRMIGPELARERRLLGRDRKQKQMVDRYQRPEEHRNADQQQLRLRRDALEGRHLHFESRFIMKYTSGKTSGSAHTMDAIDRSTWSSRR